MARRVLTGVAGVATALTITNAAEPATSLTRAESSLLVAVNEARRQHGLSPLRADGRLERAARGHSAKMLRTQTFFHGAFRSRIRGVGVTAPHIGENLAWGVGSLSRARAVVRMWLASPGHRANLLYPGYRTIGVGALRGHFGGYRGALVITTDFAGR